LDSKFDDTGGSITGSVQVSGDITIGGVNVIEEIGTKQETIQDNGLTIEKHQDYRMPWIVSLTIQGGL